MQYNFIFFGVAGDENDSLTSNNLFCQYLPVVRFCANLGILSIRQELGKNMISVLNVWQFVSCNFSHSEFRPFSEVAQGWHSGENPRLPPI